MIDAVPFDPPCRGLWERSIRPAFLIRFEHCVELHVLFSACLDGTETALGLFSYVRIGLYIVSRIVLFECFMGLYLPVPIEPSAV